MMVRGGSDSEGLVSVLVKEVDRRIGASCRALGHPVGRRVRKRAPKSVQYSLVAIAISTILVLAFVVYSVSLSGSFSVSRTAVTPTIGVIDSTGDVGLHTSIATDLTGKVHISYYDATNLDLKYATNAGGSWVNSTLDSTGSVGRYTSMAIDSNNKIHVSYYDLTNSALKYATNAGGKWVSSTLDSAGSVGSYTSIAIDSKDKVHISYYNTTSTGLKYATNAGGSWVIIAIDTSAVWDMGTYSSIAVDSKDKVHISYMDATHHYLKYATNAGGSWVNSTLDSSSSVGSYTSIAVDSKDRLHISYFADGVLDLFYATNASGSWVITSVDGSGGYFGQVGSHSSIAVDSNDEIHISYYDTSLGDLRYATNAGGSWVRSVLDGTDMVGPYTSVAVDSDSQVHISYYDNTNDDLKYATFTIVPIPEFSDVLVPVLGLICLVALVSAARRRKD